MNISIFEKDWEIYFTQCYSNARIRFSDLSNLLQLTAGEHATQAGFGFSAMAKNNQTWVLSRVRIEINRLPKWMDKVTVRTWVQALEEARSVRNFEVLVNGQIYVTASSYWAVINTVKRASEHLAIDTTNFITFPEKTATAKPFSKLDITQPVKKIDDYNVKLSDLDIVNHANNVKYLDWCMDRLPIELVLTSQIRSLEMNYLRELRHNDNLAINGAPTAKGFFMSVSKQDKTCFALQVETK